MKTTEKTILLSIGFTMLLLVFRLSYSGTLTYIFYAWNIFLAALPLVFSKMLLKQPGFSTRAILLFCAWLLFFPNTAYLLTDLFHYHERWPVPKWYDLLLVVSASWNGILLGLVSLRQVETFFSPRLTAAKLQVLRFVLLLLCGYGIYLGRFLRFNSWDVITDPGDLFSALARHVLLPYEYRSVWKFTILFAALLWTIYNSIPALQLKERIDNAGGRTTE